jgi:uncharacterized membrane protein YidH (DUF202 family)
MSDAMGGSGPDGTGDPGPADPGLAQARTSLAWTRTTLAFAAIGLLILRRDVAAGLVILALSALVWAAGRVATVQGQARARPGRLLVIALAVTGVSAVALGLALFAPQTAGLRL